MILLALLACDGSPSDSAVSGCVELTNGEWVATGPAFGTAVGVAVTMDAAGCGFVLSGWSHEGDLPLPDGGSVAGDDVLFTGNLWTGCRGTVTDPDGIIGVCAEAGGSFELAWEGDDAGP